MAIETVRVMVDVDAITRRILRSWMISPDISDRQRGAIIDEVLDYFAPEDRKNVRPIVEDHLARRLRLGGAS